MGKIGYICANSTHGNTQMQNDDQIIKLNTTIPASLAGKRLDGALATLFTDYSRALIQQWIKDGMVKIDDNVVTKTRQPVRTDQTVTIDAVIEDHNNWQAQEIPLSVVFEDETLIVINKPIGLVVHPGAGNPDQTLVNALLHHAPELSTLPRAGIIHRLDKDTSGLLVIAKTLQAHHALVKMMQAREIHREYRALVLGNVISGDTIDAPIGRHPTQRIKMAVTPGGKPAITHFRVLSRFEKHTLLSVRLETGRTHQIRVHMAHIGHPIVGDPVYGRRDREQKQLTLPHQALHAFCLRLTHPITSTLHEWIAPIPNDFNELIHQLENV